VQSDAIKLVNKLDGGGDAAKALRRTLPRIAKSRKLSTQVTRAIVRDLSALKIRAARESFWEFCSLLYPEYYTASKWHLRLLTEILQALYERRLKLNDGRTARKLMINMPPRHGKSRTLVLFCAWVLGQNKKEMIIACSYNDALATDFSRYTRDEIQRTKNIALDAVYRDVFPKTKIKHGDASYLRWALDGQHFSYLGAGVGSGITGKGCTVAIVDDPIKDAETSVNDNTLNKIWQWYTDTFQSRQEGDGIEIMNHTRWAEKDPCGRILAGPRAGDWYVLKLEAKLKSGEMLCPELLSRTKYEEIKEMMTPETFGANYHQRPMTLQGRMYKGFKTYKQINLPKGRIISYTDTADTGEDYLAAFIAVESGSDIYIIDALYTQAAMEVTEPLLASMLIKNKCNYAVVESNTGGRGFARNVKRILSEQIEKEKIQNKTAIAWKHQTENKYARIYTQSAWVMQHIYMPEGWNILWPELCTALMSYQKTGKNKHDDAADALTGLAEMTGKKKSATAEAAITIM
jgi:predicted phage terminase large subunit-like protein